MIGASRRHVTVPVHHHDQNPYSHVTQALNRYLSRFYPPTGGDQCGPARLALAFLPPLRQSQRAGAFAAIPATSASRLSTRWPRLVMRRECGRIAAEGRVTKRPHAMRWEVEGGWKGHTVEVRAST